MNYLLAFLIAIFIHISLYIFFNENSINEKIEQKIKNNKISNIQYVKLKNKVKSKIKKKYKKHKIKKQKRIIKKYKKPEFIKNKINKKLLKVKKKQKDILKPTIEHIVNKEKLINSFNKEKEKLDPKTQELIDLYGKDFNSYDKETKLFLIKNIKDIGLITKRFLKYPYLSIQAEQSGQNIVEFILYPNGNISVVKIIKSSGYYLLDDNTIETINEAYADYPRPKKPTLIKFFIRYVLR